MTPSPAIAVSGLRVVRGGNEVLHDLSFDVEAGTVAREEMLGPIAEAEALGARLADRLKQGPGARG